MTRLTTGAVALLLLISTQATADQVIADDLIVSKADLSGRTLLCLGSACNDGEGFDITFDATLMLKAQNNIIQFNDTSGTDFPDRDWHIRANETFGGAAGEAFFIRDITEGTNPLYIKGSAPDNALFVAADGKVGLGTALPISSLHITASVADIFLESTSGSAPNWITSVGGTGYSLFDAKASTLPFVIENGAPSHSIWVQPDGDVGLGTPAPEGKLHVKGNGVQLSYLESGDGGPVQVRFRTDSENRRFLAVNNANEVKSQIIFKDNEILFTGQTDSGANRWLTIGPSGILSQGGTCNVNPCDRTFDPSYFTVPPIAERAASMWQNQHLPAIGPTVAGEPINLTEKTTGIIHELEVAHIYIAELNDQLAAQKALNAEILARLAALEAK